MAQTSMIVWLDNATKTQFDALCEQFGMSANAAVNVFINAVVRQRAIPLRISTEDDTIRQRALDAFHAPHQETPELNYFLAFRRNWFLLIFRITNRPLLVK